MRPTDCCLSIIIPCYNAERFIKNTVTMFETQDIKDCEIIIVDDGSQDDTLAIAKKLEKEYSNIFIISKKNEGVSLARNEGLKYAKGRYVIFFDSDDKIEENTLSFYKENFRQRPKCDMYAFGYQMSCNGEIVRQYIGRKSEEFITDGKMVLEKILYGKLYFHIGGCLFNRKFLKQHRLLFPQGVVIGEDGDFIRRCLVRAKTVYYSSRITFTYQLRSDSATNGNTYTLKMFDSFSFTLASVDSMKAFVSPYACNFFEAFIYVKQILGYLKSDLRERYIELELENYSYLLYQKMHIGNLRWTIGIILIRLIPLDLFFKFVK